MEITYPSKLSDITSPISNCLSPSSSLASQFSHSITFSPTSSSFDDLNSRITRHAFLPNPNFTRTTTVPLMAGSPTTNLIFSLTQTPNHFNFFNHQQPSHDQQPIVDTANSTSSTNASTTHVLCR